MAIIIGEDPKVERMKKHFDAKLIRKEEQWDSLNGNTQPQMRIATENQVKESPTDPIKGTWGIPLSIEETSFDLNRLNRLASPSSTKNERKMNLSLLVNGIDLPTGINDICSDLNTPDISDLHGYVFSSGNKEAEFGEDFFSAQTNMESASPNFIGQNSPYSPEFLNQGCLKVLEENPPEDIFDTLSDEKKVFKNEISEESFWEQLVTNGVSPLQTVSPDSILHNKNLVRNDNHYKENITNTTLSTINYENLYEEDLFTQAIETQCNEISDKDKEEMVNSFLNNEETTPSCKLNSNSDADTEKSILSSFLKVHGEPAIFIPKVKYIIPKQVGSVIKIPQIKQIVRNLPQNNSVVQNLPHHNSVVQDSPHHNSVIQNLPHHDSVVQNSPHHNSVIQNPPHHNFVVQNLPHHNSVVQNSPHHNSVLQDPRHHNFVVQNTSNHKKQIIVTIQDQNTFVKNDYLNMKSNTSTIANTRINVKPPEPSPSTSAITSIAYVQKEATKRKIKPPLKYEDEITSDHEDDIQLTLPSNYRTKKRSKFSLQGLTDAEKYQRIRQQNNVASKKCRDNKKLYQQDRFEELKRMESLHTQLTAEYHLLTSKKQKWEHLVNSINLDFC